MSLGEAQYCPSCGRHVGEGGFCLFCRRMPGVELQFVRPLSKAADEYPDSRGSVPEESDECSSDSQTSTSISQPHRAEFHWKSAGIFLFGLLALLFGLGEHGRLFLIFLLLLQPATLAHLLACAFAGRIWRETPAEFGFWFLGPMLVVPWKSCRILIGILPGGGFVKWKDPPAIDTTTPVIDDAPLPDDENGILAHLHPLARVIVCLAGPAATLLLALAFMGKPALSSFERAFGQSIGSLFRSREQNIAMFRPFFLRVKAGDYSYAIGTLAAKCTASNLIPLGTTVGGMAIIILWEWLRGRRMHRAWAAAIQYVSLLVSLIYFGVLAWAIIGLFTTPGLLS